MGVPADDYNAEWIGNQILTRNITGQGRLTCPYCSPTRKKHHEECLSVSVEQDPLRVVFQCYHCGEQGVTRLDEAPAYTPPPPAPKKPALIVTSPLTNEHAAWLVGRGISPATAKKHGIVSGTKFIKKVQEKRSVVGFLYPEDNAIKWRTTEDKLFTQDGGSKGLYGFRFIDPTWPDLLIAEGELDAVSFDEAGVLNATSVPNGAPLKISKDENSSTVKYEFLAIHTADIDRAERILIATDNDAQGEALAEELARRIGREKCWKIKYPEGCKDANDVLTKHGPDAVKLLIELAEPWPIKGLHLPNTYLDKVMKMYTSGHAEGVPIGLRSVDEIFKVVPGHVTVVTGTPGSGKSEFVDFIQMQLSKSRGWVHGICSMENRPFEHMPKLLEKYHEKPFFPGRTERMTPEDVESGTEWMNQHFVYLDEAQGQIVTIDSVLDLGRAGVLRYGINSLVIDPYMYIDHSDQGEGSEGVGKMLAKVEVFAKAYDVHVFFVAHPQKLYKQQDGKYAVPKGYDISGSAHWYNIPENGMTIEREKDSNQVFIHIWKSRHKWAATVGMAAVKYDNRCGNYYEEEIEQAYYQKGF